MAKGRGGRVPNQSDRLTVLPVRCVPRIIRLHSPLMPERRKVSRYPLGIAGTFHAAGEKVGTPVVVRMISPAGCEVEHAQNLGAGKKCELYFDWRSVQIGLQAQVAWADAQGRMGLKFQSVDRDTQKRLDELCAALRTERPSSPLAGQPARRGVPRQALAPYGAGQVGASSMPPKPAQEHERRRVPRYVSELPARLSSLATGASSTVTLVTLSVLGGCLEGAGLPGAGQKCELNTEWQGRPLAIQGEVVWRTSNRAGVRFGSLEAEAEKLLRGVCADLRLQPLAPLPPEPA